MRLMVRIFLFLEVVTMWVCKGRRRTCKRGRRKSRSHHVGMLDVRMKKGKFCCRGGKVTSRKISSRKEVVNAFDMIFTNVT